MGKFPMQFGGKEEVFFVLGSIEPGLAVFLYRRSVKGAVDLDTIDIFTEVMELVFDSSWIDNPLPVGIGPTCYAYVKRDTHFLLLL